MKYQTSNNLNSCPEEDVATIEEEIVEAENGCSLVIWNDDVNTFDWVIETLIDVCKHNPQQAEQCALLIHLKGKCIVKNGSYSFLKPQRDAITDRSINATIENN